jgi:hypothetical protein
MTDGQRDRKLTQLMGIATAQGALLSVLLGKVALLSNDWRSFIADVRMMAEYSITNLEWNGTQEGDLVRSDAQEHLASALDELYGGLSNSEAQNFNPKPPAEI